MAKGGRYENTVITQLAAAFKPLGLAAGDITRTKNSGASKDQLGDVHFSPAFIKVFPAVVECKHYKKLPFYRICMPLHLQHKMIVGWWKQVTRDQKKAKHRFALLVFRVNFCDDVVAFKPAQLHDLCPEVIIKRGKFRNIIKTTWKGEPVWIMPLVTFLNHFVAMRILTCKRMKSRKKLR